MLPTALLSMPKEMTDKYRIAVMSYRVVTEGGEFIDGLETGTDGVLSYIQRGRRAHSESPDVAEYAESGMSPVDVVERIQQIRSQVRTSFIVDDTEYLLRAGRISPRINAICKAFMVHPVLVLKNSKS